MSSFWRIENAISVFCILLLFFFEPLFFFINMFSSYELNGEKKNMAVTQFEPVDARRCFPCWDEPAFKVLLF